jgi:hypothetical protein
MFIRFEEQIKLMCLSTYEYASRSLAIRIISEDTELSAKMYGKNIPANKTYQKFRQRLALYEKASTLPLREIDRMLLESKKVEVGMELRLYRLKQCTEEQISHLCSRLDELEVNLANLKEKQ